MALSNQCIGKDFVGQNEQTRINTNNQLWLESKINRFSLTIGRTPLRPFGPRNPVNVTASP